MATGTGALTELEAINAMLAAVFESPVQTLDVTGIEDVAIAKRLLSDVVRKTLIKGTANNVEREVTLVRDSTTNKIPLPANVLFVDSEPSDGADVVQRGGFLYDRENHTFNFTRNVVVKIFYHLEWADLPETIKYAAQVLAARRFQKHVLGDANKGGYDAEDETEARALLGEADMDSEDANMATDSWSVYSILER